MSPASPARPGSRSSAPKKAALFVDSRYTLQAPAETDTSDGHRGRRRRRPGCRGKIGDFVPKGGKIGYDPWLHTPGEIKDLAEKLEGKATLVPQRQPGRPHLDRPPRRAGDADRVPRPQPRRQDRARTSSPRSAGRRWPPKSADAAVLTLPESICWLFNMRGRDVPNTPFVLGFADRAAEGQADALSRQGQDHGRADAGPRRASPRSPTPGR